MKRKSDLRSSLKRQIEATRNKYNEDAAIGTWIRVEEITPAGEDECGGYIAQNTQVVGYLNNELQIERFLEHHEPDTGNYFKFVLLGLFEETVHKWVPLRTVSTSGQTLDAESVVR